MKYLILLLICVAPFSAAKPIDTRPCISKATADINSSSTWPEVLNSLAPICRESPLESRRCVKETKLAMNKRTSWPTILDSLAVLPVGCFDGYFAEGISDTIMHKMNREWLELMESLPSFMESDRVRELLLRSANEVALPKDLEAANLNAKTRCSIELDLFCTAIIKRIDSLGVDRE